ncbi:hypothetical protein [Alkalicoccus daliensis]|uniref:Uncharacterized protein n=1 Tax=Alkalicoccus daliensis TaxID=745820 RepID=A0A1H0JCM6_9BACI|nr:hypothetical protein [Alkalicoccus daliensis]SDO41273.1 hypothetical protein SAMN04488053_11330 [Alkalicoccus daliensis]
MNKRDFFKDISRLIKDLEHQDRSMVARVEEKEIDVAGKRAVLKTETSFKAQVGIPSKEELDLIKRRQINETRLNKGRLEE